MNFQNLYEKKYNYDDLNVEIASNLNGYITRKKITSILHKSKKYFRFHKKGELLAQYSSEPDHDSTPKIVMNVFELEDLKEETNETEVLISFSIQGKLVKLKLEDKTSHKTWFQALKTLKEYYSNKIPDMPRKIEDKLDLETEMAIRSELEMTKWQTLKLKVDPTLFLRDKNLKSSFDKIKYLKNKLLISQVQVEKKDIKSSSTELTSPIRKPTNPFKKKDSSEVGIEKSLYILLISQKPLYEIDEQIIEHDFDIIKPHQLPQNLLFNVIYFYNYTTLGDESSPRIKLPV